ncbi:hypothetical protein FOZ61_009456 [Perkinsus olseni]|uniref:Protein kinase domain-containing protein n=1 Tax=Perkinsus olseni TaxID=32597 RepID=A0A7J6L1K4_PEROL|nr:hypothetical protein FOZ61_009456 [Perkinsus olseni]
MRMPGSCLGGLCLNRKGRPESRLEHSSQADGSSRTQSPSRDGPSDCYVSENLDTTSNRSSGQLSLDGDVTVSGCSIHVHYQKCTEQPILGRGGGCSTVELWKCLKDGSLVEVDGRLLGRRTALSGCVKAVYLENATVRLVMDYCEAGTLLSRVLQVTTPLEHRHTSPAFHPARRSSSFGNTLLPPSGGLDGSIPPSIRDARPVSPTVTPSSRSRSSSKSPLSLALRLLSSSNSNTSPMASERVKATPMEESDAKKFVRDLFRALEQCHTCGVIHRDVKLENIVIDEDDDGEEVARLIDFGLALRSRGKHGVVDKQIVGSVHYLAPECIRKGRYLSGAEESITRNMQATALSVNDASLEYSYASDMWAAGVVLHLLLRPSVPPAAASDNKSIMKRISTMDLEGLGSTVSKEARDLRNRLLSLYPGSRLTARDALEHPWLSGFPEDDDATTESNLARLQGSDDETSYRLRAASSEADDPSPLPPPRRRLTAPALNVSALSVSSPIQRPSGEPSSMALQYPRNVGDPIIIVTPVSSTSLDLLKPKVDPSGAQEKMLR